MPNAGYDEQTALLFGLGQVASVVLQAWLGLVQSLIDPGELVAGLDENISLHGLHRFEGINEGRVTDVYVLDLTVVIEVTICVHVDFH